MNHKIDQEINEFMKELEESRKLEEMRIFKQAQN